jgi:DEAD/DEAH box helicase domain-containing protein
MAQILANVTGVETIKTLIACLGVPDFTVDELAQQAGVSRRTVDTVVRRYQHAFDRLPSGKQDGPGRPPVRWRLRADHLDEVVAAVDSHQAALSPGWRSELADAPDSATVEASLIMAAAALARRPDDARQTKQLVATARNSLAAAGFGPDGLPYAGHPGQVLAGRARFIAAVAEVVDARLSNDQQLIDEAQARAMPHVVDAARYMSAAEWMPLAQEVVPAAARVLYASTGAGRLPEAASVLDLLPSAPQDSSKRIAGPDTKMPGKAISAHQIIALLQEADFGIHDTYELPSRPAEFGPAPDCLDSAVRDRLRRSYPGGLYRHQAGAIEAAVNGADIVLASATASGKSLPFMAFAAHLTTQDPESRVLALYPARALIQDQLAKWRDFLRPLGISSAHIDGGVKVSERAMLMADAQVVLMTPDVAHAWLMSNLHDTTIRNFLQHLKLLVLDEAHVYEGAFGTNMAFLLRRLQVAAGRHQLICSTATLGEPADFVDQLTGRKPLAFGADQDGAPSPGKTILRVSPQGRSFDATADLLRAMAGAQVGRFIAFADSRRQVEQFVAATLRPASDGGSSSDESHRARLLESPAKILPYRAGYERGDREQIQESLAEGELAGVVSTSALELGLDIGDIELVLLLDVPLSVKSFWQRIGRAGRKSPAVCVVIDAKHVLDATGGLDEYAARPIERNWLYLDNRYIQYAHALCAALELSQLGLDDPSLEAFRSLPQEFRNLLDNELHPANVVPSDLYPLKQRAQDDPHHEFAIRGAAEQDLRIIGPNDDALGSVTFSQALHEAFPGSVYYYMARPYRVYRLDSHRSEIRARHERWYTTTPVSQTKVFPRFAGGTHRLLLAEHGFVAEAEMQVSERLMGFVERRGNVREQHEYRPGSPYSQKPLTRFFETTGVCWSFTSLSRVSEQAGRKLLEAFALKFGIQERDLGVGVFSARPSPLGPGQIQDLCIYDTTAGSLRLTQRLAEHFAETVAWASESLLRDQDPELARQLAALSAAAADLETTETVADADSELADDDWVILVAPGELAILTNASGTQEVEIADFRYTPRGIVYDLKHRTQDVQWTVPAETLMPIHGESKLLRFNLMTGERVDL